MGKSRLAEEFLLWASQQGVVTAKARSYAAEGQLSLASVTEWLRSKDLRAPLKQLDAIWLTEVARLLPELYAELPDLPPYSPVTEYGQRQCFFPYYLSLLAQVYGKAGYPKERLACIDEALAEARSHNERWWDAEVHRLLGCSSRNYSLSVCAWGLE